MPHGSTRAGTVCTVLIPKQQCLVYRGWWVRMLSEWVEGWDKASFSIMNRHLCHSLSVALGYDRTRLGTMKFSHSPLEEAPRRQRPPSSGPTCHLWPQTEVLCLYHNIEPTLHKPGTLALWSFHKAMTGHRSSWGVRITHPSSRQQLCPAPLRFATWGCKVLWTRP